MKITNPQTDLIYTGIGSRDTPDDICEDMTRIAIFLYEYGYRLRSGGARGADQAFEAGSKDDREIYLPWDGFEDKRVDNESYFLGKKAGRDLIKSRIEYWDSLSQGTRKLYGRNAHQVLGIDLETPTRFVVCWTPMGKKKGGTAIAINLADDHGIEVINLALMPFPYHRFEESS